MPTLRALECLIAVVDSGSVTEAARTLHASQPAVSHQLAALERELGVPLVERLPRGVVATTAARAVLADARAAVAAAGRVRTVGRAVAAGTDGRLRIGCAASMLVGVLPPTLRHWRRRHPGVQLEVQEADHADTLAAGVAEGTLDVAITPRPTASTSTETLVGTEEIVLALPADHPLAAARAVPVGDLDGRAAVLYDPTHGLAAWVDRLFAAHDVVAVPVVRTRQVLGAAQLAAAGLGFALVPVSGIPAGYPGVLRPLRPAVSRDVVALHRGDADPLVARFVADLVRRGIPVPAAVTRALAAPP